MSSKLKRRKSKGKDRPLFKATSTPSPVTTRSATTSSESPLSSGSYGKGIKRHLRRRRLGLTSAVTETVSSVEQMSPIKMQTAQEDSVEAPQTDRADREGSATECVSECCDTKDHVSSPTEGGEASTPLDPDISDMLFGLCPEDLSFSFHTSHDQTLSPSLLHEPRTACSESDLVNMTTGEIHLQTAAAAEETFFGLPIRVKECLKEHRKIDQLYDWQVTCLSLPSVCAGRNLIYSLPTSGGKTLVAELLMLQQLLLAKKHVLFILPFVSIVEEKVRELLPFADALGFSVEEYAGSRGSLPPRQRRRKSALYIATIEKANALINSLIELDRLHMLGMVVVDELHMVGEGGVRGATLESCITKLLFAAKNTQLIGMSATLSNIHDLSHFMNAEVYSNEFRPVELKEYAKLGQCVYAINKGDGCSQINFEPVRDILDSSNSEDIDQLSSLVHEVYPSSCLIFCATKKNCENVARMLTHCLPRDFLSEKLTERRQLLSMLSIEAAGVCPVLSETIPWGVAYHHSGLTADERRVLEEAYLAGTIFLITCTSTLAAGVNLPASRVILRSPYVGRQFISHSQYKQMVGRAGRSGLCSSGESIVILKAWEKDKLVQLLTGPYDHCSSSLMCENGRVLFSLILSSIALNLVTNEESLVSFLKCTLAHQQHRQGNEPIRPNFHQLSAEAVAKLVALNYIVKTEEAGFAVTNMGTAVHKGCLNVSIANEVYRDLMMSLNSLVLSSDLHLLYLVTPPELVDAIEPNWSVYFDKVISLSDAEQKLVSIINVSNGFLSKKAVGTARKMSSDERVRYGRFYLALLLHHLLKEPSTNHGVWRIANTFQCSRGFVQNVLHQSSSFASSLVHFTEELPELWSLQLLLPTLAKRLSYAVCLEAIPLMEIPGIKQGRAKQLLSIGVRTPHNLAKADPLELCSRVEYLYPQQAMRLVAAAKMLLSEKVEALQEEAEELMMTLLPATPDQQ